MASLLKNRVINEERFFLNKSNSKWVSVGVLPGYGPLNGQSFTIEIKISGDTGGVSLNVNGLKSILKMLKSISYFSKYPIIEDTAEMERGILISEIQIGSSPCYKIINQVKNTSVCIGMNSVEDLMEMEEALWAYINSVDIKCIENEFLCMVERAVSDSDALYKNVLEKNRRVEYQLMLNFHDFVTTCVEIAKENTTVQETNEQEEEEGGPAAKKPKQSSNRAKAK